MSKLCSPLVTQRGEGQQAGFAERRARYWVTLTANHGFLKKNEQTGTNNVSYIKENVHEVYVSAIHQG